MDERYFMTFKFKMSFGVVSHIALIPGNPLFQQANCDMIKAKRFPSQWMYDLFGLHTTGDSFKKHKNIIEFIIIPTKINATGS